MNIAEDQGRFLQMLVEISGASTVVEVGTFTGMSALWLARGLPPGGKLICFELVDTYLASPHLRLVIRHPQAARSLAGLGGGTVLDIAPWGHEDIAYEWAPLVGGCVPAMCMPVVASHGCRDWGDVAEP